MEDTTLPELPVAVHVSGNSTRSMSTLVTPSAAPVTTASYCIKDYTIFELASEIDEVIATEDALDIDGDGGYSDV